MKYKIADLSQLQKIMIGLKILNHYTDAKDGYLAAEHDIIYAPPFLPEKMTKRHKCLMDSLGWHYDLSLPAWGHYV